MVLLVFSPCPRLGGTLSFPWPLHTSGRSEETYAVSWIPVLTAVQKELRHSQRLFSVILSGPVPSLACFSPSLLFQSPARIWAVQSATASPMEVPLGILANCEIV